MAGDEIGVEKGKGWQEHTDPLRGSSSVSISPVSLPSQPHPLVATCNQTLHPQATQQAELQV